MAEGELVPVESSEWASPIVVVHKRDGGIRICGDFKVSISPVICSQVYPLPTPEEIFSTLANGETYTKLDLARAYKQMAVKKECQHLFNRQHPHGPFSVYQAPFWNFNSPIIMAKSHGSSPPRAPGGGLLY